MDKGSKSRRQVGLWRTVSIILGSICLGLVIAVIVLATRNTDDGGPSSPICGSATGESVVARNKIDLSEPGKPGPFHDLTKAELKKLREFLENDPSIKAVPGEKARMFDCYIFMMDLLPPKKKDVLRYLDKNGPQPDRMARVIMYRGDMVPPLVEEYGCGPLPEVTKCELLKSDSRRNPVQWSLRPVGMKEFEAIYTIVFPQVDKKVGYILHESYGTSYTACDPKDCFLLYPSPVGTKISGDITRRRLWVWADYPVEYYVLHPVDFGVLINLDSSDPSKYGVEAVWYHGKLYNSMDELVVAYNSSGINEKSRVEKHTYSEDVYSTLNRRGDPLPEQPQRPPTQVEPDGKRYSLKGRQVDYLGWSFNFRMSALTGPMLYNIRYKGERIAYELGMAEIAVYYSGNSPLQRVTDFVDSGALIGTHSKSLVPGGDCPESASFINQTFSGQMVAHPVELARSFCLFENNNGYPLRRHLSYSQSEGAFYGGLMDSALHLRSILTIVNYDYVVDFIFHQNGVVETRVMSTGYIVPTFYNEKERPYGFHIEKDIIGNIHHHMFHFKADLDISGTSNRYETLDIKPEEVDMKMLPRKYHQTKYERSLKKTEKEALYKFNFDTPKYHVVHNNDKKTNYGEIKAYRLDVQGMSKQLLPEGVDNEQSVSWARHQIVVTKQKDDEQVSSSPYAMWDSYNPVTDFTSFYNDDEDIVDQDLVFWIALGMHHIPHTEDLPLTPTVGNHLKFFLLPYNYFRECPSVTSRDHIRISHKDPSDPKKGVKVERNGNSYGTCSLPQVAKAYDEMLENEPDVVLESRKTRGIF